MRFLLSIALLLTVLLIVNAAPITCEYKSACDVGEKFVFAANNFFSDASSRVLSSPISTSFTDPNYARHLCCNVPLGQIDFSIIDKSASCSGEELFYFINNTNSKIAYEDSSFFLFGHYTSKLCAVYPDKFSELDVTKPKPKSQDSQFQTLGYTCLYRTDSLENSVVSDCDATFNGGDTYEYTVWIKFWENLDSVKCSDQCTSRLDGRVYYACSNKVLACDGLEPVCNGALLESWVSYNSTHEFECVSPWNNYRQALKSSTNYEIRTTSDCDSVISKEYTVLVDSEYVKMNILICEDN